MAISSGIRSHRAYVVIDGARYAITDGSVNVEATRKNGTFRVSLPLATPGVTDQIAAVGQHTAEIIVTIEGAETTLMVGEIDDADVDYIAGTVELSGRDLTARLHQSTSAEKFLNKTHAEVIKEIASRVGLSADVSTRTETAGNYVQIDWSSLTDGATLLEVLHRISDVEGFRWWLTGKTLVVRRDGDQTAFYPVTYEATPGKSSDATSLRIRRNIQAGKNIKVTGKSWNPRKKSAFSSVVTVGGAGGTTEYGFNAPGKSLAQVETKAKQKAKELARHELLVHVECVGDPSITPAQKLRLRGTGAFDQDFEIDRISHSIGYRGYTMEIEARSPKLNRGNGKSSPSSYKPFVPDPTVDPNAVTNYSGQPQ